jgi:uncharacterized membrane protein
MRLPDAPIGLRIAVATTLGVSSAVVVGFTAGWPYSPPAGWIVAALTYLAWTWLIVWQLDAAGTGAHATRYRDDDSTPWILDLAVLIASVASLGGVGYLFVAGSTGGDVAAVVGALSVVAAWVTVHTIYMLKYARLYYGGGDEGGIDFHDDAYRPDYGDFAYLAFTVGMTYQVSDTDLTARPMRMAALRHALLSFLLGAIILAITINLVASLLGVGH